MGCQIHKTQKNYSALYLEGWTATTKAFVRASGPTPEWPVGILVSLFFIHILLWTVNMVKVNTLFTIVNRTRPSWSIYKQVLEKALFDRLVFYSETT